MGSCSVSVRETHVDWYCAALGAGAGFPALSTELDLCHRLLSSSELGRRQPRREVAASQHDGRLVSVKNRSSQELCFERQPYRLEPHTADADPLSERRGGAFALPLPCARAPKIYSALAWRNSGIGAPYQARFIGR